MSDTALIKKEIGQLVAEARALVPATQLQPLPADASLGGAPAWRDFEYRIWAIGEKIRQLSLRAPGLRRENELQNLLVDIACDRRAHRGRQSFVLLLGYRSFADHAPRLAGHLDDPFVRGQVISTLYKMRAAGHSETIRPFLEEPATWIRNEAKRYVEWDST